MTSIEPLLAALGERSAEGKRLKDVAIREIFYRALDDSDGDVWVRRFHNHPPHIRALLLWVEVTWREHERRHARWLLNAADMDVAMGLELGAVLQRMGWKGSVASSGRPCSRPSLEEGDTAPGKENETVDEVAHTTKELWRSEYK